MRGWEWLVIVGVLGGVAVGQAVMLNHVLDERDAMRAELVENRVRLEQVQRDAAQLYERAESAARCRTVLEECCR